MKFLEKLAQHINEKYESNLLGEICIVLPNRRAGLYFRKYLSQKIDKVIWSPSIFSIEDFVCHITGLEIANQTNLLFEFYNIYSKIEGTTAQPFDEFMNWAQVLLNDYNDADINLADTVELFNYLNEVKAISKWNLDMTPFTKHEADYLKFYNSLSKYYKLFSERLLQTGSAYQGLIYKKASENIEEYASTTTFSKIIFAGFNALTTAEEKIIRQLINSGKAEIFWDADNYYTSNEIQEAGYFIRKYKEEWNLKEFNWIDDNFATDEKTINITGVPMHIGQVFFAGQLLSEMQEKKANSESTAVVLANEGLLIPMLYAIPETISDINITMGYPLSESAIHSLFIGIFTLHENSAKYSNGEIRRFFRKDIISIFNHPCFRNIASRDKEFSWMMNLLQKLNKSNKVFYQYESIEKEVKNHVLLSLFDTFTGNPLGLLECMAKMIGLLKDILLGLKGDESNKDSIDIEYLFLYATLITQIRNCIGEFGFITDMKTLHKIFDGLAEASALPFYGEPLKGLQLMGMLETRSLDFDHIILLSANENILPAGKFSNTFIPHDIRVEMGLSTYRQKESIFAYHFYRLLQRAKDIHIIYNTQPDVLKGSEKSRFITQISDELPRYNNKIKITHQLLVSESNVVMPQKAITVYKDKEIIDELTALATKGFSPSSFNTYIACPLSFYFHYVEKLEEKEEQEDTIDAATLGSVVHHTLQKLYENHKGKVLNVVDIKNMFPNIEVSIKEGFNRHYPDGDIDAGKNLLIAKVAKKFIVNFLHAETAFIEERIANNEMLSILKLEENCAKEFELTLDNGSLLQVKIKGFIDRVDSIGGKLRIIDYKTGVVNKNQLKINDWDQLIENPSYSKGLQLLIYAYLYSQNYTTENLHAGIITFRTLSQGFLPVVCPDAKDNDIDKLTIAHIEETLIRLINKIFNTDIPFSQTDDMDICENCPYKAICNR